MEPAILADLAWLKRAVNQAQGLLMAVIVIGVIALVRFW